MDERYERSADMRLLEFQREARGIPPRVVESTRFSDPDPLGDATKDDEETYVQSGTILVATLDAQPRSALIPGALVTVSLSVTNDGDEAASDVRASLPLPIDTAYRPGSLMVDGKSGADVAAGELFANGADLGSIEPGTRRTLSIKLAVEPGTADVMLVPHVSAGSGAVLGLRAMRLTRSVATARVAVVERPFYESDDDEHLDEALAPAPVAATVTVLQPREIPPPPEPPPPQPAAPAQIAAQTRTTQTKPKTKPRAKAQPKPKLDAADKALPKRAIKTAVLEPAPDRTTRPKIEVVRSVDDRLSVAAQGGPILAVRLDRKRLATLTGLFSGASFGMIAHYLVLNALAVKDALPGDTADDSISGFVAEQERLLSRALITTRLGKTPSLESVGATLPTFPVTLTNYAENRRLDMPQNGEVLLFRAFQPSEIAFLRRTLSNERAAPFMRAAQLFVGLCANDAVIAAEGERYNLGVALSAYAALATAEISRIFLRAKLSRTPELFRATEVSFDNAARTLPSALGHAIA